MRHSIAAFACLVALTGCGEDDTTTPSGGGPTSGAPTSAPAGAPVTLSGTVNDHGTGDASGGSLELELDDFYFGPTYVKAKPGTTVTITLKNEGAKPHTFTHASPKTDVTITAGGTGAATLTMPASGAVAFYCRFHKTQGMQGAFFANPGDKVTGGSSGDNGGAYGQ
jgi:plastocyanin